MVKSALNTIKINPIQSIIMPTACSTVPVNNLLRILNSNTTYFGFYTQHFTFRSFCDKGCVKKDDIVPIEELESVLRVNVLLSSAISAKWSVCCLVQLSSSRIQEENKCWRKCWPFKNGLKNYKSQIHIVYKIRWHSPFGPFSRWIGWIGSAV